MLKKLTNKKGFTLMEMLIVVAIIAVLVAIAIPTFTNQLEKAREATDAANLRAAYAECATNMVADTGSAAGFSKKVSGTQSVAGFDTLPDGTTIGGVDVASDAVLDTMKKGVDVYVNYAANGTCTFTTAVASGFTELS